MLLLSDSIYGSPHGRSTWPCLFEKYKTSLTQPIFSTHKMKFTYVAALIAILAPSVTCAYLDDDSEITAVGGGTNNLFGQKQKLKAAGQIKAGKLGFDDKVAELAKLNIETYEKLLENKKHASGVEAILTDEEFAKLKKATNLSGKITAANLRVVFLVAKLAKKGIGTYDQLFEKDSTEVDAIFTEIELKGLRTLKLTGIITANNLEQYLECAEIKRNDGLKKFQKRFRLRSALKKARKMSFDDKVSELAKLDIKTYEKLLENEKYAGVEAILTDQEFAKLKKATNLRGVITAANLEVIFLVANQMEKLYHNGIAAYEQLLEMHSDDIEGIFDAEELKLLAGKTGEITYENLKKALKLEPSKDSTGMAAASTISGGNDATAKYSVTKHLSDNKYSYIFGGIGALVLAIAAVTYAMTRNRKDDDTINLNCHTDDLNLNEKTFF